MTIWWNNLESYSQVLFIIAMSATTIMLLQVFMTFFGGDNDPTFDTGAMDFDANVDMFNESEFGMIFGLRVLSVRSALAFLSVGSWVAFTLGDVMPSWAATLIGAAAGVGAAFLIAYMMKSIEKLQSSGNIELGNAVGKMGEVYLHIPAKGDGMGKVNVNVQGRFTEFDAVTESEEPIKTGSPVKIIGKLNESTLVVELAKVRIQV